MKKRDFTGVAAVALGVILAGAPALSQTRTPTEGPAFDGSPAWFLQGSFPDPGGRTVVDPDGKVTTVPRGEATGYSTTAGGDAGMQPLARLRQPEWPHPPVVAAGAVGTDAGLHLHVSLRAAPGFGGVSAVALDSKDNLWVFQRAPAGKPQLFKFDPDYDLVLDVDPDVIGYQDKAHGMAVDAEDNVWITATNGATVMKLSPEGELLLTIGETGRRGDWDEARGQRLLWQPVMVSFGPNGDVYIAQGHGNESPNDTDSATIRPTTSAPRGSCTSTATATTSTSGSATRSARASSTRPMGSPSIRRTATSGSATARTIAS